MLNEVQINEKELYDLVFIGGGPSTVAFFSYLFQNNLHRQVLANNRILVIEKSNKFGSGCLGKYGIRTNTSAEGFLKLLYKNTTKNTNKQIIKAQSISELRKNTDETKNYQIEFKDIKPLGKTINKTGKNSVNSLLSEKNNNKCELQMKEKKSFYQIHSDCEIENENVIKKKEINKEKINYLYENSTDISYNNNNSNCTVKNNYLKNHNNSSKNIGECDFDLDINRENSSNLETLNNKTTRTNSLGNKNELIEEKNKVLIDNIIETIKEEDEEFKDLNFEGLNEQKSRKDVVLDFLPIYDHFISQQLKKIGNSPSPLVLVGEFLNLIGDYICSFVFENFQKKLLLNNTEVISIKKLSKEYKIQVNDNGKIRFLISKRIVLATGAIPKESKEFEFLVSKKMESKKNKEKINLNSLNTEVCNYKFLHADLFLKQNGYLSVLDFIYIKLKEDINRKIKIGIIGGSHSAFSCVWLLLNSPVTCQLSEHEGCLSWKNVTEHSLFSFMEDNKLIVDNTNNPNCQKKYYNRNYDLSNVCEITIFHKSNVKVSYLSKEDALKDGYTQFDSKSMNTKGRIYPFIGIRADAKELYISHINGIENRFSLVKTNNDKDLLNKLQSQDLILNAIGYTTNEIKVSNVKNTVFEFKAGEKSDEPYSVTKTNNLINKKDYSTFDSLYGIGQGYSIVAPESVNGKKTRADSVHLYNTTIAKRLYSAIETFTKLNFIKNNPTSLIVKQKSLGKVDKIISKIDKGFDNSINNKFQKTPIITPKSDTLTKINNTNIYHDKKEKNIIIQKNSQFLKESQIENKSSKTIIKSSNNNLSKLAKSKVLHLNVKADENDLKNEKEIKQSFNSNKLNSLNLKNNKHIKPIKETKYKEEKQGQINELKDKEYLPIKVKGNITEIVLPKI